MDRIDNDTSHWLSLSVVRARLGGTYVTGKSVVEITMQRWWLWACRTIYRCVVVDIFTDARLHRTDYEHVSCEDLH